MNKLPDDDGIRMTHGELDALFRLNVALQALYDAINEYGEKRKEMIPKFNFRLKGAMTNIDKVLEDTYKTMNTKQLGMVSMNLKASTYKFGVKRMTKEETFNGIYLDYDSIWELATKASESCVFCEKSEKEQKKCPLAEIFELLISREGGEELYEKGCKYFGMSVEGIGRK